MVNEKREVRLYTKGYDRSVAKPILTEYPDFLSKNFTIG